MRFVNARGRAGLLVDDQVFDLETASGGAMSSDPMTVIRTQWDQALAVHAAGAFSGGLPARDMHFGPPVPAPRQVYAVGLNYRAHAEETGATPPEIPGIFTKYPSSITGPYDDVVLPSVGGQASPDWEAELTFVLADGGRDVPEESALDHVLGYMVGQDISERHTQYAAMRQFSMGKSFETFCPIGPAIVTLDELDDPNDLALECKVNGEVKQQGRTSDMIFGVPALVAYISTVCPLQAGDFCLTGTPSGVGFPQGEMLHPGDYIETEITGVGVLRNTCVAA